MDSGVREQYKTKCIARVKSKSENEKANRNKGYEVLRDMREALHLKHHTDAKKMLLETCENIDAVEVERQVSKYGMRNYLRKVITRHTKCNDWDRKCFCEQATGW